MKKFLARLKNLIPGRKRGIGKSGVLKIPKTAQDTILIQCIYKDNIWRIGKRFSKTWLIQDTNYAVASAETKDGIQKALGTEIYNTLPSDCYAKITINDRCINPEEFKRSTLMPIQKDSLDPFRREYNQMLMDKLEASNEDCAGKISDDFC